MRNLDYWLEESLCRYGNHVSFDSIDEDFREKIIFAALRDPRFDRTDILIDGNFNLDTLLLGFKNLHLTGDEVCEQVFEGISLSIETKINQLIRERVRMDDVYNIDVDLDNLYNNDDEELPEIREHNYDR